MRRRPTQLTLVHRVCQSVADAYRLCLVKSEHSGSFFIGEQGTKLFQSHDACSGDQSGYGACRLPIASMSEVRAPWRIAPIYLQYTSLFHREWLDSKVR